MDILVELGRFEDALGACDANIAALVSFDANSPLLILDWFRKGRILLALNRPASAIKWLESAERERRKVSSKNDLMLAEFRRELAIARRRINARRRSRQT